jgi:sarcosine oxidase delta subunit
MKCPYCGNHKAKEVDREEEFGRFCATINIVLSCPDCGKESVLNFEAISYSTTDDDYLKGYCD